MNLSTSTSEAGWRRWLCQFTAWLLTLGVFLAALVIALDPYDTGRYSVFGSYGVPKFGQRLAAASLGRNPQYDTAILGNSTMQLIDPAKLKANAVSLTMPGTGPREQLAVAKWFLDHHAAPRALILGIDERWCEANRAPELSHPFPFWLYGDAAHYLIYMMDYKSLEAATRKIKLMAGLAQPLRADGYNDYEAGRRWGHAGFIERLNETNEEGAPAVPQAPPYEFVAASMLKNFLEQLPGNTQVMLVMPPRYRPSLIGNERLQQQACEKTFATIARQRPNTNFVNFLARKNLTTSDEDYWDRLHYRSRVARAMETEIDEVLATTK